MMQLDTALKCTLEVLNMCGDRMRRACSGSIRVHVYIRTDARRHWAIMVTESRMLEGKSTKPDHLYSGVDASIGSRCERWWLSLRMELSRPGIVQVRSGLDFGTMLEVSLRYFKISV